MLLIFNFTHLCTNYRLLYSNLDFTQEEQLLVEIILNTNCKCRSLNDSDSSIFHIDDRSDLLIDFIIIFFLLIFNKLKPSFINFKIFMEIKIKTIFKIY